MLILILVHTRPSSLHAQERGSGFEAIYMYMYITYNAHVDHPLVSLPLSAVQSDTTQHVLELKLKALILDTIHNIDIIRLLMGAGPSLQDHTHWLWQKQLRHYLRDGECVYSVSTYTVHMFLLLTLFLSPSCT